MTNDILRIRICLLIATCYAMKKEDVENAYERLGSIDKVLHLLETGELQRILAEMA